MPKRPKKPRPGGYSAVPWHFHESCFLPYSREIGRSKKHQRDYDKSRKHFGRERERRLQAERERLAKPFVPKTILRKKETQPTSLEG